MILSPLVPFDADIDTHAGPVWLPAASSINGSTHSLRQAWETIKSGTDSPFTSPWRTISSQGHSVTSALMPSWPSSVLCREEHNSSETISRATTPTIGNRVEVQVQNRSPKSFVSDQATENSYSPYQSESSLSPNCGAASAKSPLVIRKAVQVDEFGRYILTVRGKDRVVRFQDTATTTTTNIVNTPSMSIKSDSSMDTEAISTPTSTAAGQGPYTSGLNAGNVHIEKLASPAEGAMLRFPVLCEAITAKSNRRLSSLLREPSVEEVTLLSPIELANEKGDEAATICKQATQSEDTIYKSTRMTASHSDSKLQQFAPRKPFIGRPRAESDIGETPRIVRGDHQIKAGTSPQAWPAHSLQTARSTTRNDSWCESISPFKDYTTCPSSTFSTSQESSTSVQSIIEQQRVAMEKLTQAGFWKAKPVKKVREEKPSDARFRLPAVPEEDYVSKVSLWAWLVSSDGCMEDDIKEEVFPSSSPFPELEEERSRQVIDHPPQATVEEEVASKSWEWLSNDDAFAHDSFDTCDTFDHLELGLHENRPLDSLIDNSDPDTSQASEQIDMSPRLDQRESMTTAAIEALLSQVQQSQDSGGILRISTVRKTGASYLYQQILNKINEEDSIDHE